MYDDQFTHPPALRSVDFGVSGDFDIDILIRISLTNSLIVSVARHPRTAFTGRIPVSRGFFEQGTEI
jgi:hypothetical protein